MRNRPYGFEIYLENVKTICIRTIAHIFVDFSEKLNFNRFDDFFFSKKLILRNVIHVLMFEILQNI